MPEIKIGSNTFTVEPLPALRSFILQPRLAPVLAEIAAGIGEFLRSDGEKLLATLGDLASVDVTKMGGLLEHLGPVVARAFVKLPSAELDAVTRELLWNATCDGRPLFTAQGNPFDILLRGRTLDTWRLLWFALEANYPDFFGLLRARAARPAAASPSAA